MIKRLILALFCVTLLSTLVVACASEATEKLQEADELLRQQRWEEAVVALNRVVELDPDNVYAYLDRSWAYRQLGKF